MRVYVGQTRSRWLIAELAGLGWGECTCRGELPPKRWPWFFDNGAFRDFKAGVRFDAAAFETDIAAIREHPLARPDFIIAPDVVAGGESSLALSREWLPRLRGLAPIYLAVQDGMRHEWAIELAAGFDGIFVGGSQEWKLATGAEWVRAAHAADMPCHIGRVGSAKRVRWAQSILADSIDSALPLWGQRNLRPFRSAVERDGTSASPYSANKPQRDLWSARNISRVG